VPQPPSEPCGLRSARWPERLARAQPFPPAATAPFLLVIGAAVGMSSVPRYRLHIVLTYLALLAVLVVTTWRGSTCSAARPTPAPTSHRGGALALIATGVAVGSVPGFTYLPTPQADALRMTVAVASVITAIAVALPPRLRRHGPWRHGPWRHGSDLALVVAAMAYATTTAATIRLDPAPRIDVWYTLQGAADGLLRGENLYQQVWVGPPGRMAAFTYLPGTAVLLAPGRWLLGDVRWMLAAITLCTALGFALLGRRTPAGKITGALLLLLPGTLTQVEQAWTEPLLLGCLTGALLALVSGRDRLAVLGVALALASKQHVALLLPVLAAWPRFGPRRALAAVLVAGLAVLPWFVADPAAMWHDTVRLLVDFPPLRFADTAYIALLNEFEVQLPFWLTGAAVLATTATAAVVVHRRSPGPAVMLRWCALVLFVANLVNKQAFYNQYWLVAGLVLASWAVESPEPLRDDESSAPKPLCDERLGS
jgi:hypothetical protein